MNPQSPTTLDEQLWAAEAEIRRLRSAVDYTKAILETQPWWHDPSHDLYPLRFVLEDASNPSFVRNARTVSPK